MKKLKYLLLALLLAISAISPAFSSLKVDYTAPLASARSISPEDFEYFSLSEQGHTLNYESLRNYTYTDSVSSQSVTQTYVVTNNSVTITLKPLAYSYNNISAEQTENKSNFVPSVFTHTFVKSERNGLVDNSFVFNDTTYYIDVAGNIFASNPIEVTTTALVSAANSSVITITEGEPNDEAIYGTMTLSITYSYTYIVKDSSETSFDFVVGAIGSANNFEIKFLKPSMDFDLGHIVEFETKYYYEGTLKTETSNFIQRERVYEINTEASSDSDKYGAKMKILNNNYTEVNPLYFDINYNGFIYNFELYTKNVKGEELLFVNYKDGDSVTALASKINPNDDIVDVKTYKFTNKDSSNSFNCFELYFTQIGRYELSIYDSTYLCGMQEPNFYSTSFYIKEHVVNAQNIQNNIYTVAQSPLADEPNELEYIVDSSIQNRDVLLTIKNLQATYDLGSSTPLSSIISKIEVRKIIFTGSDVMPETTTYSAQDITKSLIESEGGDFVLPLFQDDARYIVRIYDTEGRVIDAKTYTFTVVKQAKTGFTPEGIDLDTGEESDFYSASQPYHTEIKSYMNEISSHLNITSKVTSQEIKGESKDQYNDPNSDPIKHDISKKYENRYNITYAVDRVNISIVALADEGGLSVTFMGVGDIEASVTLNGQTTVYNLNYEEGNGNIVFHDFGTYQFSMVDSMNTSQSVSYEYKQKINVSTIVLIVLSSIVVIVIVAFVMRARGRVKTR